MASKKASPTRIELDPLSRERLSRAAETFFAEHWDEPVSDLRRRLFIDWLEDEAGHLFYNRAIQDAMVASTLAASKLHDDLDLLRKMT
jgi:uncharacterized protein (DUF2164 family)